MMDFPLSPSSPMLTPPIPAVKRHGRAGTRSRSDKKLPVPADNSVTAVFTVALPVPPTSNNLFPTSMYRRRFPSKKYVAWKKEAQAWFNNQYKAIPRVDGKLTATYRFHFPDARRRDIANFEKAITDFLVTIGVIPDDSQIDEMILKRMKRIDLPQVHVEIRGSD